MFLKNVQIPKLFILKKIKFLKQSLDDAKQFAKLPKSSTKSCVNCKGKTKVDDISLNVNSFDQIMTKLDSISASIEAKSVPQTVFVKDRPVLGFNEHENSPKDSKDKLVKE